MLDNFITTLRTICKKCADVEVLEPTIVSEPSGTFIEQNLKLYNEKIDYKKTGDAEFDKAMPVLNVPQLCNFEKHIAILKQISGEDAAQDDTHFMVIEDDAVILPDFVLNMESMLTDLKSSSMPAYDFILLGLAFQTQNGDKWIPLSSTRTQTNSKIVPSKECYLIRPSFARLLVQCATPIRFDFRTYLSFMLWQNEATDSYIYHKRACIDGSKLGLCPSTLKYNNMLLFNNEYMQLMQLMQQSGSANSANSEAIDIGRVRQIYKPIERLRNPDAMHLFGILLHKAGRSEDGESMLLEAIDEMIRQGGLINRGSELMHNYISLASMIQQKKQKEMFDVTQSKYNSLYA